MDHQFMIEDWAMLWEYRVAPNRIHSMQVDGYIKVHKSTQMFFNTEKDESDDRAQRDETECDDYQDEQDANDYQEELQEEDV
ncbi:unnamed protein product [Caenorhabditis brenneri]